MRKEYSDLPADQKITYIKRSIIVYSFSLVPFLILMLVALSTTVYYTSLLDDAPQSNSTTPDKPTNNDKTYDIATAFFVTLFMLATLGAIVGWVTLGFGLGEWLANKLNLYTDFELESAERKVKEIQKILEQNTKSDGSP